MTTETKTLQGVTARMTTLRDGVLNAGPTAEGWNEAVLEYAALMDDHRKLTIESNQAAIVAAIDSLGVGIDTMVTSVKLEELRQGPITKVIYEKIVETAEDGTASVRYNVQINPTYTATARRAPRKPREGGDGSEGRDLAGIYETHKSEDSGDGRTWEQVQAALDARKSSGGFLKAEDFGEGGPLAGKAKDSSEATALNTKRHGATQWQLRSRLANRVG